jgi:hypothetical protein
MAEETVPAGVDLHVSWDVPGGAVTSADVGLVSGFAMTMLPDDGNFDIPGAEITIANMDDQVVVTRWRDNPIAAGAATSGIGFAISSYQNFHVN